jgi:flagellar FliJ protein
MRKFKFNLEKLLKIREHHEREWEIKLGQAVSECVRIEGEIRLRKFEIDRVLKSRGSIENRENEFFVMEIYKRRMKNELGNLDRELREAELKREDVRQKFLEVSKDRKVLTKLKEKREREYYKEQLDIEHNLIDEINNGRAAAAGRLS